MADSKISALASGSPAQAGDEYVVARSGANYKLTLTNIAASMPPIGATTPNSGAFTTLSASNGETISGGNLTFSSTAQRITGDFSTGTFSNRLSFQSSTTNGVTGVQALPNGTNQTATFDVYNAADPTNASFGQLQINSGDVRVVSNIRGTGTYLPMTFFTGGSERVRIDTSGNVGIGGTADAASRFEILGTASVSSGSCRGVRVSYTIPSTATATSAMFASAASTQAASFTLANALHFVANGVTVGSGSSITNQYGFVAQDSMTGATNNIGFYSNIASASGRWNFYAGGTASNYFAGNVGIGTASPSSALHVAGGSGSTIRNTASAGSSWFVGSNVDSYILHNESNTPMVMTTNNTERMRITAGGEVYIAGTADQGAYNLQCNGTGVWGAGAYVNGSDERLKDDITTLDDGLSVVSQLRPVTFKYKPDYSKDQSVQTGFIAQELQAALEGKDYLDGVVQAGPTYLNVAYQSLIPILTKAIQEQQVIIDELKAKVAALEAK